MIQLDIKNPIDSIAISSINIKLIKSTISIIILCYVHEQLTMEKERSRGVSPETQTLTNGAKLPCSNKL